MARPVGQFLRRAARRLLWPLVLLAPFGVVLAVVGVVGLLLLSQLPEPSDGSTIRVGIRDSRENHPA